MFIMFYGRSISFPDLHEVCWINKKAWALSIFFFSKQKGQDLLNFLVLWFYIKFSSKTDWYSLRFSWLHIVCILPAKDNRGNFSILKLY